ncbi:MAG: membrane protein insertion efficiency factor YidD [Clostridia bacterium]|nr:membrane protein insertion efficiency factor YidD [Clostridia bacterium]
MDDFIYEVVPCEAHTENNTYIPKNPLNRPTIHYKKPFLTLLIFIIIIIFSTSITLLIFKKVGPCLISDLIVSTVFCFILRKKIITWLIHCYQHYAPDRVRLKCVFEPSCSEYMLLAVNKYGFFKGLFKGIKRLLRCHPPGGVDYP